MGRETLKDSISPREPAVNEKAAQIPQTQQWP